MDLNKPNKSKWMDILLIILILISLAGKFVIIPFNEGMWWDEAVYLGLGQGVLNGHYSMLPGTTVESFRPPTYPIVIALFSASPLAVRLLTSALSLLAVIVIYKLGKDMFGKRAGLWSALFISANYYFVFFSPKALSESLLILLVSSSLLLFHRYWKTGKYRHLLLSGLLIGLALTTRYLSLAIVAGYFLIFLYLIFSKRNKPTLKSALVFACGFVVGIIHWIYIDMVNFGMPFFGAIMNMRVHAVADFYFPLLEGIFQFFGIVDLFLIIGLYFYIKKPQAFPTMRALLVVITVLSALAYVLVSGAQPRFLLVFIPIYAMIAAYGVIETERRLGKWTGVIVTLFVISLMAVSMVTAFNNMWIDTKAGIATVESAKSVAGLAAGEGDTILSVSYPYAIYFSGKRTITLCGLPENTEEYLECTMDIMAGNKSKDYMESLVEENNVKYVIYFKFDYEIPPDGQEWFEGNPKFSKVSSFEQWGDPEAAVIYKYVG